MGWRLTMQAELKQYLLALILIFQTFLADAQALNTVAGNGFSGYTGDGGPATSATMVSPYGIDHDQQGNFYFTHTGHNVIRKVDAATGLIITYAGCGTSGFSGDGGQATSDSARFGSPIGIYVHHNGDLYIADQSNHRIRWVEAATGILSTFAGNGQIGFTGDGGPAWAARINTPEGVGGDKEGNIYIADAINRRIRKVNGNGIITTICGDGVGLSTGDGGSASVARLSSPRRIRVDNQGNIYVLDRAGNPRIRRIDKATNIITRVAGGGSLTGVDSGVAVNLNMGNITDLDLDSCGNLYVAANNKIWYVNMGTGKAYRIAGNGTAGYDGEGTDPLTSRLQGPFGISVHGNGDVYYSDWGNQPNATDNYRVRRIQLTANFSLTHLITQTLIRQQYTDADGDTYGDVNATPICATLQSSGYSINKGDCDDNNAAIHYPLSYFIDGDQDSFGGSNTGLVCATTPPVGYSITNDDCNDGNNAINPAADEICNQVDDNCDNLTDDADPEVTDQTTWYVDTDGDGYGDEAVSVVACFSPPGYSSAIPFKSNRLSRVLASAGGYLSDGATTLSWTFGQNVNLTLGDGSTLLTQGFQQPYALLKLLNLKAFIEGFYMGGGQMQAVLHNNDPLLFPANYCDSVTVSLHAAASPYEEVASKKVILLTDGTALVQLPGSLINGSYYIVLKHRNSIETWSKVPVTLGATTSFDFTEPGN